jgi:hypothetical protein
MLGQELRKSRLAISGYDGGYAMNSDAIKTRRINDIHAKGESGALDPPCQPSRVSAVRREFLAAQIACFTYSFEHRTGRAVRESRSLHCGQSGDSSR